MLAFAEITDRALHNEIVRSGKKKSRGDHRSPAPTVSIAVKRDSDGRNPFSHYPCYVELTSSAHEPSPRGEGGPRQRWMRCARAEGVGECAITNSVDITMSALRRGCVLTVPLFCYRPQMGSVALRAMELYEIGIKTKRRSGNQSQQPLRGAVTVKIPKRQKSRSDSLRLSICLFSRKIALSR